MTQAFQTSPPPVPKSPRRWPWIVAVLALLVALVVVVLVKSCPPVPAPAGKPVPAVDTTGGARSPVPGDSKDGAK